MSNYIHKNINAVHNCLQEDISPNEVLQKTYLLIGLSFIPCALGGQVAMHYNQVGWGSIILVGVVMLGCIYIMGKFCYSKWGIGWLFVVTFFFGMILEIILKHTLHKPDGEKIIVISALMVVGIFIFMSALAYCEYIDNKNIYIILTIIWIIEDILMFISIKSIDTWRLIYASFIVLSSSLAILWRTKSIVEEGETSCIRCALGIFIDLLAMFIYFIEIKSWPDDHYLYDVTDSDDLDHFK